MSSVLEVYAEQKTAMIEEMISHHGEQAGELRKEGGLVYRVRMVQGQE